MKNNILINAEVMLNNTASERSAWNRGVKAFAIDLLDELDDNISNGWVDADDLNNWTLTEKAMLNGANDWNHYAWSGCGLCYNSQIAEALCTPSELKRTHKGALKPNKYEDWLDVYARAMYQAAALVQDAIDWAVKYIKG